MKVLAPIGTNPVTDSLLKMKALPVGQYFGRFKLNEPSVSLAGNLIAEL